LCIETFDHSKLQRFRIDETKNKRHKSDDCGSYALSRNNRTSRGGRQRQGYVDAMWPRFKAKERDDDARDVVDVNEAALRAMAPDIVAHAFDNLTGLLRVTASRSPELIPPRKTPSRDPWS